MKIIFCVTLLLLFGCESNQHKQGTNDKELQPTAEQFLALYQDANEKVMHIYPIVDLPDGEKYAGTKIDSAYLKFLDDSTYIINIGSVKRGTYSLYACYKIPITQSLVGLITRTPSQYEESSIDLFLWDTTLHKIVGSFQLADEFGDEGWYFEKESWLFPDAPDKMQIVTRQKDHNPAGEENTAFTVTDTIKYFRLNNYTFIQEYPEKTDSAAYTLKFWK